MSHYCGVYYKLEGTSESFQCRYYKDSKLVNTKAFVFRDNKEEVFEKARHYCLKLQKVTQCEYRDDNIEDIMRRYHARSQKKMDGQNVLIDLYSNLAKFRAVVRHAYKSSTYDYLKELFEAGLQELEACSKADREQAKAQNLANEAIAKSLLQIEQDTGFSMIDQAPNDIVRYIMKQSKTKTKPKMVLHELNGETWDGIGHMPASYKIYLRENPDKQIEDLMV